MLARRITYAANSNMYLSRSSSLFSGVHLAKQGHNLRVKFVAGTCHFIHQQVKKRRQSMQELYRPKRNSSSSKIAPWSIQSLSELNGIKLSSKNAGNNQSHGGIRPDSAQILVQDVSDRLAQQYSKCEAMLDQLEYGKSQDRSDINEASETSDSPESSLNSPKKVIRAANNFNIAISFREQQMLIDEAKMLELKAKKLLKDLKVVHRDTLQLTKGILESNNIFNRFNESDRATVAAIMEQIRSRHAATVEMLADIAIDLRRKSAVKKRLLQLSQQTHGKCHFISESMVTRFLEDRLGVQLLCDHYLGFHKGRPHGGISANIPAKDVISDAVTEMTHLCDANHGWCPPVEMRSGTFSSGQSALAPSEGIGDDVKATLIRPWVHHALGELLKNAMEATVQQLNKSKQSKIIPLEERVDHVVPIIVHVDVEFDESKTEQRHGKGNLAIHVIDHGTGFGSAEGKAKAFVFAETGFSGKDQRWDRLQDQQSYAAVRSPLSSLGVGLPLSRLMMRLFGGDLILRENLEINSFSITNEENVPEVRGCTATITIPFDLTICETTWRSNENS